MDMKSTSNLRPSSDVVLYLFTGAKMSLGFLVRRYAGKIDLDGKISNNSGDDLKRWTCLWIIL